jgi:hypothetical protein
VDKKKVSLSVPKKILREARHFAFDQGVPLSGFLVEAVTEHVKRLRKIQRAGATQRALMRRGLKLGTHGKAT